ELTFNEGLDPLKLKRQARAGVALSSTGRSVFGGATLAFDADLTRTPTATGDARRVGGGGEIWTVRRILGVRSGVSASTIGDRRTAVSGGVSVALRQGLYFDGQLTG